MKFDKNSASKKQKSVTGAKVSKKISLVIVKAILICFLAVLVIGGCAGFGIIKGLVDSAPDISQLSVAPSEAATYIYDMDGNQMQKLTAPTSNRTLVKLEQIPKHLQYAVVAVEDERFYKHNGIDVQGIARAFVVGIKNGGFSEGASTITQQLLKNNVFTDWMEETSLAQKFKRKFQEQYLALELEKTMSKDQILEDYLNTINLGAGAYGVQAAAHRYFGKDVSELTLSESTVIAGITQNPTQFNPITNAEKNAIRREKVLNHMLEQEYISQAEFEEVMADDVYSRIQKNDAETEETSIYSYYVDALIDQVMEDLQVQQGYSEQHAYKLLYSGGLKIYSAQDESIQKICDEEFSNPANFPPGTEVEVDYALSVRDAEGQLTHYSTQMLEQYFEERDAAFRGMFTDDSSARNAVEEYKQSVLKEGDTIEGERLYIVPQPQASVVMADQSTGYVKAIVGGRGDKEASLTLNRATDSRRQPGSTFKILTTYAPAIDKAGMSLGTVYDNAPFAYSNGVEVNNWDSYNAYTGLTTIREAITNSINIVAVKCLTDISPRLGFEYTEKFGISTLYEDEARQPLALGGLTDGVVNVELAAAYATIANGGQYNEPKFYTRIEDQNGNVIIDNTPVSSTVIKESTAFLLTNAMQDVVTVGTGSMIDIGEMPVAGKTGTTDDYRNIWFSGYTPYYTCSVWAGYDNNDILPSEENYHNYHKTLWNSIMQRVHSGLQVKQFEEPDGIETAEICKKSGKLAVEGVCNHDSRGSMVYTEYFARGKAPTEKCDVHVAMRVCQETGLKATATCNTVTRIFVQRPKDSEGTTDDSKYGPPWKSCAGHKVVEELDDDLFDLDKKKKDKVPEESSGNGTDSPRAEEDGDVPTESAGSSADSPANAQ